jgi:hypothetical protein
VGGGGTQNVRDRQRSACHLAVFVTESAQARY